MSGIKFSFKLKAAFGSIPSTEKIESTHASLMADYLKFNQFRESDEFKNFLTLEKRVQSDTFKKSLEAIKADTFEKSPQYKQWKEFDALSKSSAIKKYNKYLLTGLPDFIAKFENTKTWTSYQELNQIVNSSAFKTAVEKLKAEKKFDGSKEASQLSEFDTLKKNADLQKYLHTIKASAYQRFKQTSQSSELKKLNELQLIVQSDEFKKIKAEKEDKERYKKSEEYQGLQRYESIKNSAEVTWYYKTLKSNQFEELEKWNLTFSDEFNEKTWDPSKWITNYYYGKTILNEPYSLSTDKHFPTDGKNLEFKNSVLNILTKKEAVKGKVWDPKFGFYDKEFQYTSGMISSGDSFRQDIGRFEAKVLLPDSYPVMNSFWLSTGKMLPEVNIFNTQANGKIILANHWGPKVQSSVAKLNGSRFLNKWFIFGLDWTKEKLVWTINGVPVREEANGLPNEPMFIVFNSAIMDDANLNKLPSSFQIDWVRVYKKVK
jgi:beta-glucanase (GH16 family)